MGRTLRPFDLELWLGYSINILKYEAISSRESELAVLGGGELTQRLSEVTAVHYGYSHVKDGIYGSPTGGYTGPFYFGGQWIFAPNYYAEARLLSGLSRVYEWSIGVAW